MNNLDFNTNFSNIRELSGGRLIIVAGDENDLITGGEANDTLAGGRGSNFIDGRGGDDFLFTSFATPSENDALSDTIIGGAGNDTIFAGGGDDLLVGASATGTSTGEIDLLSGGSGGDTFVLGTAEQVFYLSDDNTDSIGINDRAIIQSFNPNEDVIELNGSVEDYSLVEALGSTFIFNEIGNGDIIGQVEGVTGLDLADANFNFNGISTDSLIV